MKNYWIAFVLIVSLGFIGLGILIYKCFIQKPESERPIVVYLNIEKMQEAGKTIADTNSYYLASIFQCHKNNIAKDPVPWADLYVCKSYTQKDSLSGDTALLFIDLHPQEDIEPHQMPGIDRSVRYKPAPNYKKCKVLIPASQLDNIKRYRYKFGNVKVDEELED